MIFRSSSRRAGSEPGTGGGKVLALLLVLGLLVTACGTDAGETTTEGSGDGGATTTGGGDGGDEGEGGELLVWVTRPFYVPPDEFASFEEEYGDTVTYDVQANDDILQQWLRMRDAGQTLPDVLGADDAFLIENYVDSGLLIPHDDIAAQWEEEDPDLYNALLPGVWDETTIDGVKYGASIVAGFDTLYYNAEWFEEAGVTVPFETLEDVLNAMRAMKVTRPDSIPMSVQAQAGQGVTSLKTMLAAAGTPFDGAVPDLTSEGALYVIDWWIQAANEELIPPEAIAWGEDENRGAFVAETGGMIIDSFTAAGDFNEVADFSYGEKWDVTPLPLSRTGGGNDGVALSSARTWAVTSDAEDPELAGKILRYIAETDNLVEAGANGSIPFRQTEALNDPRLQDFWPFFNDALKEAYINSAPTPAGPNGGEVEGILEQMFGEIVVGTDKTAPDLANEYQPLLDSA